LDKGIVTALDTKMYYLQQDDTSDQTNNSDEVPIHYIHSNLDAFSFIIDEKLNGIYKILMANQEDVQVNLTISVNTRDFSLMPLNTKV
jgi:hypothetical protein